MNSTSITQVNKIKEVILLDGNISFLEFIAIAKYHAKLQFADEFLNQIQKSRNHVDQLFNEGKAIYGVTTGFGDNVKYRISSEDAITLQKNILRSHACSVGNPLLEEETRAIILMIILNTGKGVSGIKTDTINLLKDLLNYNLYPFAPCEGSVGYLSVEAHISLTLIGEGYFLKEGKKIPSLNILSEHGLQPVNLGCKEGLLLISGTTSATALGLLSLYHGMIALKHAEIGGALVYEALRATTKALEPCIHNLKLHPHQKQTAAHLLSMLSNSQISIKYRDEKVQDACSLRAMPQILGACNKLLDEAFEVFSSEMMSVSDNPVLLEDTLGEVQAYMTGNFDGTYIATHADMLAIAFANAAGLAERLTDRMLNHHVNEGLPAFLTANPGLNNGFMILQYTSAALTSELKQLATPASIDSITTCAGQEDPVSMAYNASKKANEASKKLILVVAIELLTALQAIDFVTKDTDLLPSPALQNIKKLVRRQIPFLEEDRYLYEDIELITDLVKSLSLIEQIEADCNIIL
jgi:histidine ammonia-lyase